MKRFVFRVFWTVVAVGQILRNVPTFWQVSADAYGRLIVPPNAKDVIDQVRADHYPKQP